MQTEVHGENKSGTLNKEEAIQLLTFKLDEQEYALDIANVVQVVRMVAVTRPPKAPEFMEGMFNLRGKVIPVIDTRKRFGLPPKSCDLNTQLLIARADGHTLALTVDSVSEVLMMPMSHIEPPDNIGIEVGHLLAVGKLGDRLILILDPSTLLADAIEISHKSLHVSNEELAA